MKLIIFSTIIIILLIFILPAILSFGINYIPQNDQPSLDKTQKIYGYLSVSQAFISKNANLSVIGVSLKNPNLTNKKDITLSVYEGNVLLRSSVLNGSHISDGKFVKFKFEPIVDSENKSFLFILAAPATTQEEADNNNALEVFLTNQRNEGVYELLVGDKIVPNTSVAFVSFSKPPYPIYVLETIYSKWLNKLMADWKFFTVYAILIFTLAGFLLYQLARSRQGR